METKHPGATGFTQECAALGIKFRVMCMHERDAKSRGRVHTRDVDWERSVMSYSSKARDDDTRAATTCPARSEGDSSNATWPTNS